MLRYSLTLILSICFLNQNFSQINSLKNIVVKSKKKLTDEKINKISITKEAYLNLVDLTFSDIMIKDGFLKNESIKIKFPTDAKKMKDVLIKYDKGNLTNDLVFKMNRTAERVCKVSKDEIIIEITKYDFSSIKLTEKTKLSQLILQKGNVNFIINKNLKSELRKNNSVGLLWNKLVRINNKIPISRLSWTKSNNFSFEKYLEEEIIRGILFSLEQRIKESSIKLNYLQ
ncbi:MAG: DUF4197 family protein [Flavobacteriales bacterium TMED84]|nr:MAG: DUF4197 family protein [Flavobacteriales bacterium TMED84]|tara:strand:+ start:6963 stop:7649 length:687 start_codon:yes stop_codon:yes gene_type:complete